MDGKRQWFELLRKKSCQFRGHTLAQSLQREFHQLGRQHLHGGLKLYLFLREFLLLD